MATKNSNISIFGTIPADTIFNPVPPYNLRNDCQVGQWKRGEDDLKGNSLEISVIKASKHYGNLGDTKKTHWLQLWFVASPNETKIPRNTICCTYLKTRSLESFGGKLVELMTQEVDPGTGIFKTTFEKHSGKMGNYYSLNWEFRDREGEEEEKQLNMIADFINTNPTFYDPGKPKTLICTDGMTPEQIEALDDHIDSLEGESEEETPKKQLAGANSKG